MTRKNTISAFLLLFLILLLGGAAFCKWKKISPKQMVQESLPATISSQLLTAPSPTPVPFAELTIPYLRSRTYQSNLAEIEPVAVNNSFVTSLTSYDSDGLKINALITQPAGMTPENGYPAIVFVHGYIPPTQYRTEEKYVEYVNALARSGFVVLKIDLRGHGDSEGEPGGAYYSSDYVIDTLNAYAALQSSGFVDPKRIGLWGHSMAGNVVLRSMAVKPEIPAAVVWAGAVYSYQDFLDYGIDDNSYQAPGTTTERQRRRQALFDAHGQFRADSPFWSQVAVTKYLPEITGAIQLHHAANDDVVSVEYSRNLKKLLDEAGRESEYHEYKQGGHNISGASFGEAMRRTVEFFRERLKLKLPS